MKTTIVTTTVNNPTFLSAYAKNVQQHGHYDDVDFIVVGDKKTPEEAALFCSTIPKCSYMSPMAQDAYMDSFPELNKHLPWNTIARRNIGHLLAYQLGADVIVLLDDDNLATNHDVIRDHGVVGSFCSADMYESRTGWMNVCSALEEENGVEFYPRGYPPSQRWKDGLLTKQIASAKVAVNAGLWINDPDIDAITRLERRLITTGLKQGWRRFSLQPGTWSPWNCQNTAIAREVLPSYFLSPHTGRHLDIWASYITTRIAEHLGEIITFGVPLAFHDRSPHNLYKDLREELPWIEQTDDFVKALRETEVTGRTYHSALPSIIDGLTERWATPSDAKWQYIEGLQAWHETLGRLGAK